MLNIAIGGLFNSIYWESGVLKGFLDENYEVKLYTSGSGSIIGVFYGLHGTNFFPKVRNFLGLKDNPFSGIISEDIYKNSYKQGLTLWKLGTNNFGLNKISELKEFLDKFFKNAKLKDMQFEVYFEAYNLDSAKPEIFDPEQKIADVLLAELVFPPYYEWATIEDKKYVSSSVIGLIPMGIPEDTYIVSYDHLLALEAPKNAAEILLKVSDTRKNEIFKVLAKNHKLIEPVNTFSKPFSIEAYADGIRTSEELVQGGNI